MTCTCPTPQPHTRPSGTRVCLNESCGGKISTETTQKKERP